MAFTTSNVNSGSCGDMYVTRGSFTAAAADAAATLTAPGGIVYACLVSTQDASGAWNSRPAPFSTSGTQPVTITVYNLGAVTNGKFIILSK